MIEPDKLDVVVRSRKKTFFKGTTYSVTSLNDKGEFDILSQHANFISLVRKYIILNKTLPDEQKIAISSGVLRVKENNVQVFLNA